MTLHQTTTNVPLRAYETATATQNEFINEIQASEAFYTGHDKPGRLVREAARSNRLLGGLYGVITCAVLYVVWFLTVERGWKYVRRPPGSAAK
jgi:hypothetical protein